MATSKKATTPRVPKGAETTDAEKPDLLHLTRFEEDDDPASLAGDFLDEDGDGVDDRTQT